ncbi:hypothetical protein FA13DRAFT_1792639 [Coprinellus micaceus]|uniref:Uncharacterized protein n=1 Tax=Coprinellus micaceus TaxID=71717 RepID=A0A4Y7T994_COPMI|nr:hypothetical protein FA13DRAFT_1792639 [Coprinellus micaceus]
MNRLPPELLLVIFDLAIHTSYDPCAYPVRVIQSRQEAYPDPKDDWRHTAQRIAWDDQYPDFPPGISGHPTNNLSPVHLSHVCQRWRKFAFEDADLWSTIYITNGAPGYTHLLQLWLENSGALPLDLVFRDGLASDRRAGDGDVVAEMLDVAAAYSERWRTFKIRLRRIQPPIEKVYQSLKHVEAPNLESLAFSFNPQVTSGAASWLLNTAMFMHVWMNLIGESPRLHKMQLWSTVDYRPEVIETIPFERLTTLVLPMVWFARNSFFISALAKCENLQVLAVSLDTHQDPTVFHPWPPLPPERIVSIPSLRRLQVASGNNEAVNKVLSVLDVLGLRDLSIHTNSGAAVTEDGPEGLMVFDMVERSGCKLVSFEFRDEDETRFEDRLESYFNHDAFRGLRNLRVGGVVRKPLLELLTVGPVTEGKDGEPTSSVRLPNLRRLHLESLVLGPNPEHALTSMMLSRREPPPNDGHVRPSVAELEEVEVGFQVEGELESEMGYWDEEWSGALRKVGRKFDWVGTGDKALDKELMLDDFSLIQGWMPEVNI